MSLISEKPDDLESTNELDNIDDPELDENGLSIDRYLAFGTSPRAITNPPKKGEVVEYRVKVTCTGESWKERTDGEIRYSSQLEILSVARSGEDLPPDHVSKKQQKKLDADEKAKVAAEAKGKGLYDEPQLPYDGEGGGAPIGVDGEPEQLGDIIAGGAVPTPEAEGGDVDGEGSADDTTDNVLRPEFSSGGDNE